MNIIELYWGGPYARRLYLRQTGTAGASEVGSVAITPNDGFAWLNRINLDRKFVATEADAKLAVETSVRNVLGMHDTPSLIKEINR